MKWFQITRKFASRGEKCIGFGQFDQKTCSDYAKTMQLGQFEQEICSDYAIIRGVYCTLNSVDNNLLINVKAIGNGTSLIHSARHCWKPFSCYQEIGSSFVPVTTIHRLEIIGSSFCPCKFQVRIWTEGRFEMVYFQFQVWIWTERKLEMVYFQFQVWIWTERRWEMVYF